MDVNLKTISFLRRDQVYNFTQIDDVYEEIVKRNVVYNSPVSGKKAVEHDSGNVESESFANHHNEGSGAFTGASGQDDLLSAPANYSNRNAFNFICSLPYTSGDELDQNIEKIRCMAGESSKAGQIYHGDVKQEYPISSQSAQNTRNGQYQGEIPLNSKPNDEPSDDVPLRQEDEVVELPHSTNTNDLSATEGIEIASYSLESDQVHRVRKKDIPASVRTTLAFGIEQQRAGGESLESEQQRRLNEFTLWRRELMHSRVASAPSH